jgi:hypothetical protein
LMTAMMNSLETISGEWARDSDRQIVTSRDSTSSSGTMIEHLEDMTGAIMLTSPISNNRL